MTRHDDDRRTGALPRETWMQGGHGRSRDVQQPVAAGQQQQYGSDLGQQGDAGGHGSFGGQAGDGDPSRGDTRGERFGGGYGTGDYGRRSYGSGGYGSSTFGPEYAYGSGQHGEGDFDPRLSGTGGAQGQGHPAYATYGVSAGAWGTGFRDAREDAGASTGWRTPHDDDYVRWRSEQLRRLDADYHDWRRERSERFPQEFDAWRSARASGRGTGATGASDTTGDSDAARKSDTQAATGGSAFERGSSGAATPDRR